VVTASNRHNPSDRLVPLCIAGSPNLSPAGGRAALARLLYCCLWHPLRDPCDTVTYMGGQAPVRIDSLMRPPMAGTTVRPPAFCPSVYIQSPVAVRMRKTLSYPVYRTPADPQLLAPLRVFLEFVARNAEKISFSTTR